MVSTMQKSAIGLVTLIAIVIGLAACGGTATTSQGSGAGTSAASSDTEAPQATMAVTTAAGTDSATTAPSSDTGTSVGVCELVTADEVAGIFGFVSVSTMVLTGPPDSCIVEDPEGNPLVAWSYTTADARLIFEALALPSQSESVPGIGDQAAFVENTGLLVLKGDALLTVSLSDQDTAKEIATIAAGRM